MPLTRTVLSCVALALSLVTAGWAQLSTTAQITGTVTDPSGASVPNAQVIATNTATETRTTGDTNADGTFVMSGLVVGTYNVTVRKPGFKTFRITNLICIPQQ